MRPKQIDTRGLPFKELRGDGKFYVDKSMLIADLLRHNDRGVYLYTRPRRFGKSTNISMLDAFFNIKYNGNDWFDGLEISEHREFDAYRNAYPVVYLDFKGVESSSFEDFLDSMATVAIKAFDSFYDTIRDMDLRPSESAMVDRIWSKTASKDDIRESVGILCGIVERAYGRKVVVLIDEYDRPVTESFRKDHLESVIRFLGLFLTNILKGNESVQMAYVTGVMQVAKSGIFSGLNNLSVNNVCSRDSDERFGFTEDEIKKILSYYGHPEKLEEARGWYDGYRFGDAEVYNPFSIMSYVSNRFTPANYWTNTGNDKPMSWLISRTDPGSVEVLADLVSGSTATSELHLDVTYEEMSLSRGIDLYSLMVMTGYLKAVPRADGLFDLSIPNREVMEHVDRVLKRNLPVEDRPMIDFCRSVRESDGEGMESSLAAILAGTSYFDMRTEAAYEILVLTVLRGIPDGYEVMAQREHGNGRTDIMLTPRREGLDTVIIELKTADTDSALQSRAEEALRQIHDRRYYNGLSGDVILVGIAFHGVVPKVAVERLSL